MKRLAVIAAVGALVLGAALPALAQAPTVSFSGEWRVVGVTSDNLTDYKDTAGTANKDSRNFYAQRVRLFTTVTSADKKAKAVWGLEVGDVTWGLGGGANGAEFGGTGTRVGPSTGGELGADGVAVETKQAYIWFEVPGIPNAGLTVGIQNVTVLATPSEFFSDDQAAIKFDWKSDQWDLQLFTSKFEEGSLVNPDDVDAYGARFGINVAKDLRFTVEGMIVNTNNVPGSDFGDTYWVGGTVGTKVSDVAVDAAFVYGQRKLACAAASACTGANGERKGWGTIVGVRAPAGPLTVNGSAWYTSGDKTEAPGTATAGPLTTNTSDKMPTPENQGSWYPRPLIAEAFAGHQTIGGPPGAGSPFYAELAGTYGVGGSALYSVMPELTLGGGVAYVGATDAKGIFGDNVFEIDAGGFYTFNANLGLQMIASYLIPDTGDNAWSVIYRLRFAF
ncbi:MAG: hypothetical protein HY002_01565 [Candidatus Rokubacteria bacterium]|nr:hypothetical protein [Candidatus Rokubacteria bacterium]